MENSTINKREWFLWVIAIISILFSSFAVWQIYTLKLSMMVMNDRTERAENEFNLREQTAVNFSAQYPVSGTISKIENNKWTIDVKVAQDAPAPSIFTKVGDKTPREIKYDIKKSVVLLSETATFLGKKKEEFAVGDEITAYSMDQVRDISQFTAMRVEIQGYKPTGISAPGPVDLLDPSKLPKNTPIAE